MAESHEASGTQESRKLHIFDLIKTGMHRCADRDSLKVMLSGLENKTCSLEYCCGFLFQFLKNDIILNVVAHKSVRLLEFQISSHKARARQADISQIC